MYLLTCADKLDKKILDQYCPNESKQFKGIMSIKMGDAEEDRRLIKSIPNSKTGLFNNLCDTLTIGRVFMNKPTFNNHDCYIINALNESTYIQSVKKIMNSTYADWIREAVASDSKLVIFHRNSMNILLNQTNLINISAARKNDVQTTDGLGVLDVWLYRHPDPMKMELRDKLRLKSCSDNQPIYILNNECKVGSKGIEGKLYKLENEKVTEVKDFVDPKVVAKQALKSRKLKAMELKYEQDQEPVEGGTDINE